MNVFQARLFFVNRSLYRLVFWCSLVCTLSLKTYGQCVVYQDENQKILTSCEFYNSSGKSATAAYRREIYLGSPYLTYPVWQDGSVQVKKGDRILPCELAYNLVNREVMCRFKGDSTVILMTPERFVIQGVEYIRQPNRSYATWLSNGPTKLVMIQWRQMEANHNYSFTKDKDIIGVYKTMTKYYIQKGEGPLESTNLSKKSILTHLADRLEKIRAKLPASSVTPTELIDLLAYYDSLGGNKPDNQQ